MEKTYFLPLTLFLFLTFPVTVSAASITADAGYNEEGIFYEIHDIFYSLYASGSISVTKECTFHGNIFPSLELEWSETIKGVQYSGTLYLQKFYYSPDSNQTVATYEGILTK